MSDLSTLCLNCFAFSLHNGICQKCGAAEAHLWTAPHHLLPRTLLWNKYLVGKGKEVCCSMKAPR